MTSLIGKVIDRYRIVSVIGEGGMATVYKATDTRLERDVAVKVIRTDSFPPEQLDLMRKRFEREAKTLAKLSHPNIVDIIDYGEYEGAPYLVMIYLPGGTVKQRIGHPMPWQEAAQLLIPIAHALEYAHDHNVINRDVKPSNILLTEKGQPKLTDFGLVKLLETEEKTHLTTSGTGMGTPDYMAPEQWVGETTPQSDIYSLGVVLYELITNHRPFTADTPAGILIKQAQDPLPPPHQYIPNLPRKVEAVILKALDKDPKKRYENMRAFANAMEDLLLEEHRSVLASTLAPKKLFRQENPPPATPEAAPPSGQAETPIQSTPAPEPASIPEPNPAKTLTPISAPSFPDIQQKPTPRVKWPVWFALGSVIGLICSAVILCKYAGIFANPTETPSNTPGVTQSIPGTSTFTPEATFTAAPTSPPAEITDKNGVVMRYVEAGDFTMGNDNGSADVQPESVINLDAFYIDKYEVTNVLYRACFKAGVCRAPQKGGSATHTSYFSSPQFDNYPVIFVNWNMAKTYCEWRGARLPTEAEWEKAARGTDGRTYPWGENLKCSFANYQSCVGDTTAVGSYEEGKSPYGVYDMAGNVWEWVSSLHRPYPYNPLDGREDLEANGNRVARGGSWNIIGGNVNSDNRYILDPSYYGLYVGFRCAKSP